MLNREKTIETIKLLPQEFSVEELIDRILLLEKIENGLKQSKAGQITPDELLHQKLPKWF